MRTVDPDEFSTRHWPDWSFWRDGDLGRGQVTRGRVFTVAVSTLAVLGLVPRVIEIAGAGHGPLLTAIVLGVIACYAVGYPLAVWSGPMMSRRSRVAVVAAMSAAGIAPAVLLRSPDYLTDMTYAVVIGLMVLPLRHSLLLGVGTATSQIGWMALDYGRVHWAQVGTLLGVTVAVGAFFALMFTVGHLRAAREQVRILAVARERERVARDLHDILGHSLSTMTVKAGLARRILESSGDTAQAIGELRELESLSRQALSDVRATVSGHRTVTLAAEIAGARAALRAGGVQAEFPAAVDGVAPELHGVFGYVVREAVTNVLRHSDATRCQIRLGRDWVEITDNGSAAPAASAGHGLAGLAERLAAVPGGLEHGRHPGGGFRVLARGGAPTTRRTPDPAPLAEAGPA